MLGLKSKPRAWQSKALIEWDKAGNHGIVEVITGGGKTFFAEMCIERFSTCNSGTRFLILAPTLALLDQWYVSLREDFQLDPDSIALWSGTRRGKREPALFNVMTLNTARELAPAMARDYSVMLVVDECHRAGSPQNSRAISGAFVATLGLSATPERPYDDAFRELIIPNLGPIIFSYGFNEAREDAIITDFDLVNVGVDFLPQELAEYNRISRKIGRLAAVKDEHAERGLKILLQQRARVVSRAAMRIPISVRIFDGYRGIRALVFHEYIDQAELLYRELNRRHHSVTIYHSRIGPALRRDNLRLFRRGAFDILVSCRSLDEGINLPEARLAIIASASATERQRIQRLGRVLRPAPGKKSALIYTLYATDVEAQRLVHESEQLRAARSVTWQRGVVKRA